MSGFGGLHPWRAKDDDGVDNEGTDGSSGLQNNDLRNDGAYMIVRRKKIETLQNGLKCAFENLGERDAATGVEVSDGSVRCCNYRVASTN